MSSNSRITYSKGTSEGLSLPYDTQHRKEKGKKSTSKQEMAQQFTSATQEMGQLQQQAVAQLSLLLQQFSRPTSSQSITNPSARERPPQLDFLKPQQGLTQTIPPLPVRVGTPQVPFQTLSQYSGSSEMSAPLFTEDRYNTRLVIQKWTELQEK